MKSDKSRKPNLPLLCDRLSQFRIFLNQITLKLYHVLLCNSILDRIPSFIDSKWQEKCFVLVYWNSIFNMPWSETFSFVSPHIGLACEFYRRAETVSRFYGKTVSLRIHENLVPNERQAKSFAPILYRRKVKAGKRKPAVWQVNLFKNCNFHELWTPTRLNCEFVT